MMSRPPEPNARLFVALPLPEQLKAKMETEMEQLRKELSFQKWVHPQDLHLTLVFLGDTAPEAVEGIIAQLKEAVGGHRPFPLGLKEAGVFGQPNSPRVLWAGVDGALEALKSLQADISSRLQTVGYVPESRPYSPHLTLARRYTGSEPLPREALAAFSAGEPAYQWTADRVVLYQTRLNRLPMYEELASIPLS
ncbi:RNA 2',3'-cyclic phosphodiesterase [Paenibacillus sp. YN15]|uniref:RNA 2',3'-cyclic phosphodiesterase n=1 Tax=Paenibacillus sp. YN15 TaxID=1742774 RepID=UPI000DCF207D|nr:RNA 2',3'-cyclic phosphodiesterase [Paenibacillus sp. YN15]RAV01430.1 RNA 2',3'-cyclic phosphodiesterase [Paenibacillus sp. YN15]